MNDISVAWIPKQEDDFLTKAGVEAVGGKIIEEDLTESQAESKAFALNNQTKGTAGKYIVVRM